MRRELGDGYELDDDPGRIDVDAVHAYLSTVSYWAEGRPREMVERHVREAERVVGLYHDDRQIGFWKYALGGAMLFLSWLMISNVRYPSFKKVGWGTRGTLSAIVLALLAVVITLRFRYVMPVVLFSIYLIYGLIRPLISQRLRKEINELLPLDAGDWLTELGNLRREVLQLEPLNAARNDLLHQLASREVCSYEQCPSRVMARRHALTNPLPPEPSRAPDSGAEQA